MPNSNGSPRPAAVTVPRHSPFGIVARGFCMGCADAVPGVSGGTMAFILGIYERLLNALGRFDFHLTRQLAAGRFRAAWHYFDGWFLALLAAGIATALIFVTRVIDLPRLLNEHPTPVYGLFFGLIVGSLILLLRGVGHHQPREVGLFIAGVGVGWLVVNLVPMSTSDAAWMVALAGMLAISAMLLPGISGSYILLILGKYEYVLAAIRDLRLLDLAPFAAGCAVGLLGFARVLSWLLKAYERHTIVFINGLLLGSLWRLWPFQAREFVTMGGERRLVSSDPVLPQVWGAQTLLPFGMILIGLLAVLLIGWFGSQRTRAVNR